MWLVYDNIAVFMTALVACVFAWLYGGTIHQANVTVIPWLLLFLVDIMMCFPQRHRGESIYDARERVWYNMKRDPLVWVALVFLVLMLVPFVNKGLCPICDYTAVTLKGVPAAPPIPLAPFCVDRQDHFAVLLWFAPALASMVAVKHSLLKRGKRAVLAIIVANGLGLSLIGLVQQVTGAEFPLWQTQYLRGKIPYFFSTFGYPNMGGDYFTMLFGISMALWGWRVDRAAAEEAAGDADAVKTANHKVFWRKHFMLIPAAVFFLSAMATLSRAAIILVTVLAVLMSAHALAGAFKRMGKVQRVRACAASLIFVVTVVLSAVYCMPESINGQFKTTNRFEFMDRLSGRQQVNTKVAIEVLKDHFFFGCGGWGYKHFAMTKVPERDRIMFQSPGTANVHNDYLQFAVEHGVVGLALLAVMVALLLKPVFSLWRALANSVKFRPPSKSLARPVSFFIFPAPAFFMILSACVPLVHAFADCPLRSPAVLTLFFVSLAAIDGFLPKPKHSHRRG